MDTAKTVEEEECEDWCFVCKDGGSLMLCDYKDCPKVYHASCIEKGISLKDNEESFVCEWHSCYLCNKRPQLCCLCCPHAVCEGCVTHAEFIHLKENKGLCNECQEYVFALEEIQKYNAAQDKIDLTDQNTFESLFLGYWEIVKNQQGITFDDVRALKSRKKGAKLRRKDNPKFSLSDAHTQKKKKKGVKLKNKNDPKLEFIRWGSKPLIDFLTSIGEDTREAMSQDSVESVIRSYIHQKNLLDREKKKKVRCDEKLYSIFRKKSVKQKKIYKLLNAHLKENLELSEKVLVACKKQKTDEKTETCEKEVKPVMRSTGLATINSDNIKLVYLRKSLVVELLKQHESFEDKVVGSFVKVKNNPRDSLAYQILQVTGIKTGNEESEGVFLYVAGMASDVSISKLDDSDIRKEEIEELKQKVMHGLLRQPTVVEMEQKAKALHEDITKHWIARELIILQRRINYANEKGRRKELNEYLDQRELLRKPSEQERLIRKTPNIIEELVEIKREPEGSKQGNMSQEALMNFI